MCHTGPVAPKGCSWPYHTTRTTTCPAKQYPPPIVIRRRTYCSSRWGATRRGIAYNPDQNVRFAEIQKKLQRDGHNIPSAQIFDCVPLGNGKIESLHYTTDPDWKLFTAVWEHPKAVVIFNEFYSEYTRFNNTRAPGDDFHVVFYCKHQ